MLDIDTLNALDDLNAETLYQLEATYLNARLPIEEHASYIERARAGEREAREALILHSIGYIIVKAKAIHRQRNAHHIDFLDLVQEAHLSMIEAIEAAMQSDFPISYLATVGVNRMHRYCTSCAPLIQRPGYSDVQLAQYDPHPTVVYSLDARIFRDSQTIRMEFVEAPPLHLGSDNEERQQEREQFLQEVLKRLSARQQTIIIHQYGLFGESTQSLKEIAEDLHMPYVNVKSLASRARRNLIRLLRSKPHHLLYPEPAPEKD